MDQPNQPNPNQMPINFEPFITALTGANILFDEEQFIATAHKTRGFSREDNA